MLKTNTYMQYDLVDAKWGPSKTKDLQKELKYITEMVTLTTITTITFTKNIVGLTSRSAYNKNSS